MNIVDDIRAAVELLDIYNSALDTPEAHALWLRLQEFIAAYDALAPDWTNAPAWANWYAVDADGGAIWYADKPEVNGGEWMVMDSRWTIAGGADLPIGIDWRLYLFQRPA